MVLVADGLYLLGGVAYSHQVHYSCQRDCHVTDIPTSSILKHHPAKGEGGCSRMTVSPTAKVHDVLLDPGALPHREFWAEVAGLVADGTKFAAARLRGERGVSTTAKKDAALLHGEGGGGDADGVGADVAAVVMAAESEEG